MYALQMEYGNGYHCQCCRRTWERIEEYDTFEEAMKRIASLEHVKENYRRLLELGLCSEDADDIRVLDFFELNRPATDAEMIAKFRQEKMAEMVAQEVSQAEVKRLEKEEKARQAEINKRAQYEKLKAEFEGGEA